MKKGSTKKGRRKSEFSDAIAFILAMAKYSLRKFSIRDPLSGSFQLLVGFLFKHTGR